MDLHDKIRNKNLQDVTQEHDKRRKSSRILNHTPVSHRTDSNQTTCIGRRRSSIDQKEVMPFYLKKKYDHRSESSNMICGVPRMLSRRSSIFLDNEKRLSERQFMASSADLGTVSFKSFANNPCRLNEERAEAIRRQSETKMDFGHKHRPRSGDPIKTMFI